MIDVMKPRDCSMAALTAASPRGISPRPPTMASAPIALTASSVVEAHSWWNASPV
jgi:hypothetical protein